MILQQAISLLVLSLFTYIHTANADLPFDIYGDSKRLDPSDSIKVDKRTCTYTGTVEFNFPKAEFPFPSGADSCTMEDTSCEGQSCLLEIRNVYDLGKKFRKYTGFDHVGFDWSPCGHPPLDKFGKPHLNMHIFRITPKQREKLSCDMLNPFICTFPSIAEQTTVTGKKYFVVGVDAETGKIVNAPDTHEYGVDTAVPGEGLHAWNVTGAADVEDWDEPILITGLYGGGLQFWEPMFPSEFVSGDVR